MRGDIPNPIQAGQAAIGERYRLAVGVQAQCSLTGLQKKGRRLVFDVRLLVVECQLHGNRVHLVAVQGLKNCCHVLVQEFAFALTQRAVEVFLEHVMAEPKLRNSGIADSCAAFLDNQPMLAVDLLAQCL